MRSLTLVRHAKSSWADDTLADFDRPLNERGRRDAPLMAQRLAHAIESPLRLVSSPALRAATTAAIFADALQVPRATIRFESAIYDASSQTLLQLLRGFDDADRQILMFGHNPGLSDFCHLLARCDFAELPTCAVARFDFNAAAWRDITPGSGRLMAYNFPKERQ